MIDEENEDEENEDKAHVINSKYMFKTHITDINKQRAIDFYIVDFLFYQK